MKGADSSSLSTLAFHKYSGCGNDFLLLDRRCDNTPLSCEWIQSVCHRQKGVGADGVVSLHLSDRAQFRMVIHNADGSRAGMCGNGLRCLASSIYRLYPEQSKFSIESDRGIHQCSVSSTDDPARHLVEASLPPSSAIEVIALEQKNSKPLMLYYLDTGVPHGVIFGYKNPDHISFEAFAKPLRFLPELGPDGANINLVEIVRPGVLSLRTYERGVEGETLACGTGASAAAVVAVRLMGMSSPIKVQLKSGDCLKIDVPPSPSEPLLMTGTATMVFEGKILTAPVIFSATTH